MTTLAFTDLDRRTIANLSIPRNVDNLAHELRVDPHTKTRPSAEVNKHLLDLEKRGLVLNLGEHEDPAHLAANLPAQALPIPDDKAEIYSRRMLHPRHSWRFDGDLWMITVDGLDRLKEPTVEAPAMPPAQVQAMIDAEWARTLRDVDPENIPSGTPLAQALLIHEFEAWAAAVADECERVWNVRPKMPMGGGSGYTDTYESALIDAENQKTALGAVVDPWYMALTILAFTDTDTGTTADDGSHKPTYTGYARKSVAGTDMNAASSGSASNANAITFAACTAGSSTIVGFGNCSASTNGTLRKYGTCSSTTISTTQTPPTFAAGAYTTSTD